ncbi:YcdB/YcdC domain-containing protein [Paenibacillus sp. Marseille-Q4541]|uniref:YcdB/YcdC domain-containing protein n=1 Tax=Paenibacillus sp. Marseille-Q4541 TaxID=2831522 RepID=UPI001BABD3A5|nr:YcdB/YcdC domain-containing protein [Paenibacillus sp. Marseille-Q4541]
MDKRSSIPVKKVAAAMAAIMLGVHTQGAIQSVSAASAVVSNTKDDQAVSSITDSKIPTGAKISSNEAHKKIVALFPELSKATLVSVNYGDSYSYPKTDKKDWDLQYQVEKGTMTHGFNARVSGETGEVLSVHVPEILWETNDTDQRISKENAAEISKTFLRKALPNLKEEDYRLVYQGMGETPPLFGHAQYSFSYQLKVNGLPASDSQASISVHDSGKVVGYSRSSLDSKYPSSTPKVTQAEAEALFKKSFDVQLAYIPVSYPLGARHTNYYIGYVPTGEGIGIDANTGKILNSADISGDNTTEMLNEALPTGSEKFKPAASPISQDEAVALIKKYLALPEGYVQRDTRLVKNRYGTGKSTWDIRFEKENVSPDRMFMNDISVQVDQTTGEIKSYNLYTSYTESEQNDSKQSQGKDISKEVAKEQVLKTILALVPNASEELKLTSIYTSDDSYSFSFSRYINGVSVYNDGIQMTISKKGIVQSYYNSLYADAKKLPAAEPSVTKEQAIASYLKEYKLELGYQGYGGYYSNNGEVPRTVKLVYNPTLANGESDYYASKVLDGVTAKWRSLYSSEEESIVAEVVDIKGHQNEKVLENMISHGVLVPSAEGKVEPERTITKGDWYTYLARAVYPNPENGYYSSREQQLFADVDVESPYYQVVSILIENGWLEADSEVKLSADDQITREQLSEMIVSILKYDKLSKFYQEGSDLPSVADASQIKNKGAASLAIKLDLLPLIDGRFLPERLVTVAEASKVLSRLAELQGKLDFFMNSQSSYRYY